ncbi:unnamed protein product [Phaedon cochleariae]|uniref:BED-type domain-containing protein n=1 Tax=Phaedon cochleariae TaxID=80249 RepID=A0A9P0DUY6_PHACE|nr:unnamed protein product [Phaedon cochleariae]
MMIPFRRWELHELPALTQGSTIEIWSVKTCSALDSPRYVIVFFQTKKADNLHEDVTLFDNANIKSIRLALNSDYYPQERMLLDFSKDQYADAHFNYTEFNKSYHNCQEKRSLVNFAEFKSRPMFVIDCSRRYLGLKSSTVDMNFIKRSLVWNYFEKKEQGTVTECISCKKKVPNKGNTSNLMWHLKSAHPKKFRELEFLKRKRNDSDEERFENESDHYETSVDNENTPSISEDGITNFLELEVLEVDESSSSSHVLSPNPMSVRAMSRSPKVTHTKQKSMTQYTLSKRQEEMITDAVVYFIATSMQPYNIVEQHGFKHLMKTAVPSYKLPSRKTLSECKIPKLYNETVQKIKDRLAEINEMSFTTDCWTSTGNKPYIALTAHYISKEWKLEGVCLNCAELNEDHTSDIVAAMLSHLLCEWNLEKLKHQTFTTDSGANIIKAIEILKVNHIPCFGHSLNTGVEKSLRIAELQPSIGKVTKIQSAFAHSWKLSRDLHEKQRQFNLPIMKIPSYSRTRWWSMLRLISVVVEQHIALVSLLGEFSGGKYKHLVLNQDEVSLLQEVIKLLRPMQDISEHMSGESYVTASTILPLLNQIQETYNDKAEETQVDIEVNSTCSTIMNIILKTFKNRYIENQNVCRLLQKCTFFDPRFKTQFFEEVETAEITYIVNKELKDVVRNEVIPPRSKKKLSGLAALLKPKKDVGTVDSVGTSVQDYDLEITKYLGLLQLDTDEDPLLFWNTHTANFPRLSILAKRYLCIQATSVPSERVFSKGGRVVTDVRSALTTEHAEQLIVLSLNRHLISM